MAQKEDDRSSDKSRKSEDSSMEAARRDREQGKTIGRGMTSPDSTQVPLSAETGEPDERALRKDKSSEE